MAKIPDQSPVDMPNAHCPVAGCGKKLRLEVLAMPNGKITGLKGHCDTCQISWDLQYTFCNAQVIRQYEPPKPPDGFGKQAIKSVDATYDQSKPQLRAPESKPQVSSLLTEAAGKTSF